MAIAYLGSQLFLINEKLRAKDHILKKNEDNKEYSDKFTASFPNARQFVLNPAT